MGDNVVQMPGAGNVRDVAWFAKQIQEIDREQVEGLLDRCDEVAACFSRNRELMGLDEFEETMAQGGRFSARDVAQMLAIAGDERLRQSRLDRLPWDRAAMHAVTRLSDAEIKRGLDCGAINSHASAVGIIRWARKARR
jgi:hypothetical protein